MRFLVAAILAGLFAQGAILAAEPTPPVIDASQRCTRPKYPAHALQTREEGAVTMRFFIEPDGTVQKSEIISSSGYEDLDEAAVSALRLCHFKPSMIDGQPNPDGGWSTLKYTWKAPEPDRPPPPIIEGSSNCGFPLYPESSVAKNETGRSVLTLSLDETGAVSRIDVESSGFPRLDAAARTTFGSCRFSSTVKEVRIPVAWEILNGSGVVTIQDVKTIAR